MGRCHVLWLFSYFFLLIIRVIHVFFLMSAFVIFLIWTDSSYNRIFIFLSLCYLFILIFYFFEDGSLKRLGFCGKILMHRTVFHFAEWWILFWFLIAIYSLIILYYVFYFVIIARVQSSSCIFVSHPVESSMFSLSSSMLFMAFCSDLASFPQSK